MITNIPIDKLYPHPQNPRRELGDLSELAESIKARGILQNLTVVPRGGEDDEYTVIIGHRRHAAGRIAGLEELPCVVADLDDKEQIATMLLENIQRSDLTIFEQAQGFQLMMDMGDTISNVAVQTGFSDTTIRKRIKLLELDRDKLAQSAQRGATMADYEALGKIKDIKTRNKVLDKIGTSDFDWDLKTALSKEANAENKAVIIEKLNQFASKISSDIASSLQHMMSIYPHNGTDLETPEDAGTTEYFYTESTQYLSLYKEWETVEKPKKSAEQIRLEKKRKNLQALFKQAYELRIAFAKDFKAKNKMMDILHGKAAEMLLTGGRVNTDAFREVFGIKKKFRLSWEGADKGETYEEAYRRIMDKQAGTPKATLLFLGTYLQMESPDMECLGWSGNDTCFRLNKMLKSLYQFLTELGYRMSGEELALMDGTHEAYGAPQTPAE